MDGFVTRRTQRSSLNERSQIKSDTTIGHMRADKRENAKVHTGDGEKDRQLSSQQGAGIKQSIGESLQAIDAEVDLNRVKKKKKTKRRRIIKLSSLILGLILLIIVGFIGYKAWQVGAKIFNGDLLGVFQQQELKKDQYGRSNVLVVGTTDDIRPGGAAGASLTDSMMVMSVDQEKKDAYIFSIPRDLQVEYGRACSPGYKGKINAYFACVDKGTDDQAEQNRMDGLREFVGKIFDMDIQYVMHINTTVIREAVDAVGGITVEVEGTNGAPGVYDEIFDQFCKEATSAQERKAICPTGHYLDLKNGPNDMDGRMAMAFSQARGSMGGNTAYGLDGSNFAREQNQQRVLIALKEKATSTGTLTDINKVLGLMDAMGNNLRTNIETKEIQTVMKIGSEMSNDDIHRLTFVDPENMLMKTGSIGGQSIVQPAAGLYDYSEIRTFLKKTIYATPLSKEAATIAVLNGGGVSGAAQTEADKLKELGFQVKVVKNAPEGEYGKYTVYQLAKDGEKPESVKKLEELYGKRSSTQGSLTGLPTDVDFIVIIGFGGEAQ